MPYQYVKALIFLLIAMVAAQSYDPNISNGTCWYSNDEQADDAYIPCGNDALRHQSCCQARDICLSSKACYNGQYGVTYLAGCTDPTYKDDACPQKLKQYTQEWVGLVRCYVSNDTDAHEEEWAGCLNKQSSNQPTVRSAGGCSCNTDSNTYLFIDSPTLTPVASLPVKTGNDIAWYPGFSPATPTDATTATSTLLSTVRVTISSSGTVAVVTAITETVSPLSAPSLTRSGTSTDTDQTSPTSFSNPITTLDPNTDPYPAPAPSLSTESKVGIGVGSAGGVVLIGALLVWLAFRLRKKKSRPPPAPAIDQIRPRSPSGPYTDDSEGKEELVNNVARDSTWSGHKAELPAEDIAPTRKTTPVLAHMKSLPRESMASNGSLYQAYRSPQISEVEGSPGRVRSPVSRPMSTKPAYEKKVYEMPG